MEVYKRYYLNNTVISYTNDAGEQHNLEGPAFIDKLFNYKQYYINDIKYSPIEYLKYIQDNYPENFSKVFAEIMGNE